MGMFRPFNHLQNSRADPDVSASDAPETVFRAFMEEVEKGAAPLAAEVRKLRALIDAGDEAGVAAVAGAAVWRAVILAAPAAEAAAGTAVPHVAACPVSCTIRGCARHAHRPAFLTPTHSPLKNAILSPFLEPTERQGIDLRP